MVAQVVIGGDQHDVVVHHNTCQRDHPDTGHHHAKGLAHDHQAKEHTDGRHDHRRQHQTDRDELVELRQEDGKDQEQRCNKGFGEKRPSLGLLFILACHGPAHALGG